MAAAICTVQYGSLFAQTIMAAYCVCKQYGSHIVVKQYGSLFVHRQYGSLFAQTICQHILHTDNMAN